jgi:hypothetical protein
MSDHDMTDKMKEEVRARIVSSDWDNRMARRVLEKKERSRRMTIFASSLGGFAAAAVVAAVLFLKPADSPNTYMYARFISGQVNTTYSSIFGPAADSPYGSGSYLNDDVDEMISETLAMR